MNENFEFIGRPYESQEKESIKKAMKKWSGESLQKMEGELEKTDHEIKVIEKANELIKKELHSLGIKEYTQTEPERIHFFPHEIYAKNFPNTSNAAFFLSTSDIICIDKDSQDSYAKLLATVIHEMIHRTSKKRFYAGKEGGISDARTGYRIRSLWKDKGSRMTGFNEMMNDATLYKILLKNKKNLTETVGITENDIGGPIFSYFTTSKYGPLFDSILIKVSTDKKIPITKVFEDFERGQFNNSVLVLKDIEKSFGKGSIKILSLMGGLKDKEKNDELDAMIKKYFAEESETKRKIIEEEIQKITATEKRH